MEVNTDSNEDIDSALSSLEDALTSLSTQEGDVGKELAREILLRKRLCSIFSNQAFEQFVEVQPVFVNLHQDFLKQDEVIELEKHISRSAHKSPFRYFLVQLRMTVEGP